MREGEKVILDCVPFRQNEFKQNDREYFRIVYLERGSGKFNLNSSEIHLQLPVLFYLNESDTLLFHADKTFAGWMVRFLPSAVNSRFDLENIRRLSDGLMESDYLDAYLLDLFTCRNEEFPGYLQIGKDDSLRLEELKNRIRLEVQERRNESNMQCMVRSNLIELLFFIGNLRKILPYGQDNQNEKIIAYLKKNYQKTVSLIDLAREFASNKTTLNKSFSGYTGKTVMVYLQDIRLELALSMIRETKLSFTDIMKRVGIKSHSYFSRTIREKTKMNPSEYRKFHQEKAI